MTVAAFPATTIDVINELLAYATGGYKDEQVRLPRDFGHDYSEYEAVRGADGIDVQGLLVKADRVTMAYGWRVLVGVFTLNGELRNAALLLSPDLTVVRSWHLDEVPVGGKEPRAPFRKFVHGLDITPDGSVIFTFDGSISLQRMDACGQRLWTTAGNFHHAVTLDDTGHSVWTFDDNRRIAQVAVADGEVLKRIPIDAIIRANPEIDVLQLRREFDTGPANARNVTGRWLHDPLHFNDVDPLPAALAGRYPNFEAGDLLLSARSLNLTFVLNPDTLKIKWWRIGAVQRQHDPDWMTDGRLLVLNNRRGLDYSTIVAVHPGSFQVDSLYDGRRHDFYTSIRGKHQLTGDGHLVVTSSQQGRVFELNDRGELVFDLANTKPGHDDTNYVVSEMKWFPTDHFQPEEWTCPKAS